MCDKCERKVNFNNVRVRELWRFPPLFCLLPLAVTDGGGVSQLQDEGSDGIRFRFSAVRFFLVLGESVLVGWRPFS